MRIALRDLARYRARSGSALAAISFAAFLAVIVTIVASVRFSNVLDYAGPNLSANQLIVYTPYGQYGIPDHGPGGSPAALPSQRDLRAEAARVGTLARSLHARSVLALDSATKGSPGTDQQPVTLFQAGTRNQNFTGPLYVATPALLRQYGISASEINPATDIITMRPGLATEPRMQLVYSGPPGSFSCAPASGCIPNPEVQPVGSLPSGTSAPNTVITPHIGSATHIARERMAEIAVDNILAGLAGDRLPYPVPQRP